MKNIVILIAFILCVSKGFTQEAKFGITAGYLNLNVSSYYQGSDITENASGFYAGILGDFKLSEAFHLEPAAIYGNVKKSNVLFIPVLAKYYIGQSGFNLLAGPQATMILDEINPRVKRIGWDLSLGGGFDVTDNIFLQVKYALEITNRHNDEIIGDIGGINAGINSLFAGIGYKF
jgi:opacity protein-like surface antigen